ncbi:MAG: HypC/HybG/HupF family hydrogenase formation chaperone [Pirellulales bacterium]|nr:HypC/HybG/HupF family hydrogenase formation chaperone [Pirellulales bacterium]
MFGRAEVEFAGTRCEVHMACVPDADIGHYVVVHAGIAICIVDESEARKTIRELRGTAGLGPADQTGVDSPPATVDQQEDAS